MTCYTDTASRHTPACVSRQALRGGQSYGARSELFSRCFASHRVESLIPIGEQLFMRAWSERTTRSNFGNLHAYLPRTKPEQIGGEGVMLLHGRSQINEPRATNFTTKSGITSPIRGRDNGPSTNGGRGRFVDPLQKVGLDDASDERAAAQKESKTRRRKESDSP